MFKNLKVAFCKKKIIFFLLRFYIFIFVIIILSFIDCFITIAESSESDSNKLLESYNSGIKYFNQKKFESAIEQFQFVADNDIDSVFPETLSNLVNSYILYAQEISKKNQHEKSLELYQKILKIDSGNSIAKHNSAAILIKIGNEKFNEKIFLDSIYFFEKAKKYINDPIIDQNIAAAYYNEANKEKNFEQAVHLYKKSLDYNPDNLNCHYNLGVILFNNKLYNESKQSFNKILEFNKSDENINWIISQSLYFLALINESEGNFYDAEKYYYDSIRSGLTNDKYLKSAIKNVSELNPNNYNLQYKFDIFNNSDVEINNISIKINIPSDVDNKQKVLKTTETIPKKKYKKDYYEDNSGNKFINIYFDSIGQYEKIQIILESYITVFPSFYNLKKIEFSLEKNFDSEILISFTKHKKNYHDIIKRVYDYVNDILEYKIIGKDLNIKEILSLKKGKCVEYTALFNHFMNQIGFKTRSMNGEIIENQDNYQNNPAYNIDAGHNWPEVFIDSIGWVPFDPTFEDTGKKNYFAVGRSDRVITSIGKINLIDVKYKIEYDPQRKPDIDLKIKTKKQLKKSN